MLAAVSEHEQLDETLFGKRGKRRMKITGYLRLVISVNSHSLSPIFILSLFTKKEYGKAQHFFYPDGSSRKRASRSRSRYPSY